MSKLMLEVLADANPFIKTMNQAQSSLEKFQKAAGVAGQSIGGGLNNALQSFTNLVGGGAAAAGVLGGAIAAVTTSAVAMTIAAGKQAEQLQQLSGITGINTDKLQEYEVMLNRAGLSGDDLAHVMKTLSTSLDQARLGTGSAGDRFRQLGIDIRTVTSTDDLIRKVASAAGTFADGVQKAALMSDLLGKGWQVFMRAFAGGKNAFDEMAQASKALGQTLSSTQIDSLTKMDDAIDDLILTAKRFGQQVGASMAPSIKMIVDLMKDLLAWGSHAFDALSVGADVFAVRITHMALKAQEVLGTLFSTNVFSGAAWKQALGNIAFIDKEADKQIAKLTAAAALSRSLPAPKDARTALPAMIDTHTVSSQQQALIDAQLKTSEALFADQAAMAQASLDHYMAILEREKAFGIKTEQEVGLARQAALGKMDAFTEQSLKGQLENYRVFIAAKEALFTNDLKGQADKTKFLEEATRKETELINKISVAHIKADTTQITSGLAVRSFWQQQLSDIVASNVFSVGLIVTTWTSGMANAIVNGGDFVKAAWKSTEIAVVQGALNMAVVWAAKQALMLTASESTQAAITAFFGLQEAARTSISISGSKAAAAAASVTLAGTVAAGSATMGILAAVLEGIVGFMLAVAAAVAGVPLVGQVLAGTLIVGATLAQVLGTAAITAATAAMTVGSVAAAATASFASGGIGDFGSGTQATLHGKEAIIPLNSKGAGFMQEMLGTGGQAITINVPVNLDGRKLAQATARYTSAGWRYVGAPA